MTDPWCWYINANIKGVYWWDPWHTIYSSTMDPMGLISYILSDYYHPISPISPSISTGLPPSPWRPILPRWRRPCKGSSRSESWSGLFTGPRDVRVTSAWPGRVESSFGTSPEKGPFHVGCRCIIFCTKPDFWETDFTFQLVTAENEVPKSNGSSGHPCSHIFTIGAPQIPMVKIIHVHYF